ncbi:MAG: hypothetical protein OXB92_04250 [Acidimicrobiaceae bacterium]|nr:hypothetical protein [Acidimicrobiia bacterium]MCY4493054.1 hypothetical protein [Acidimicrobiaceae bacterium]
MIALDTNVVVRYLVGDDAAHRYGQGGPGFSDLMILSAAERSGAAHLHTFDRRLAQTAGAVLVEHTTGDASR